MIYYNITATFCKSLSNNPTRWAVTFTVSALTAILETSQSLAYSEYLFGKSRFLLYANLFLLLVVHVHMRDLKTMPVNIEYAHLQTQNLREKLVILEALFKSFSCFQYAWNLLGIFIDDWSQDCQVYKKNLSCCSFQWNQTTWTWGCVSKAYNFLKILANSVDSMLFRCFCYS